MSIRYIGSKARIVDSIMEHVGSPAGDDGLFIDAFAGTGAVAAGAFAEGWRVRVNDGLKSASVIAAARLLGRSSAEFSYFGGYSEAIEHLKCLKAAKGYVWRTYSPASNRFETVTRQYFTEENAAKIDAIRQEIRRLSDDNLLNENEELLLLADLLLASSRVANTAGTYGCFLRNWSPSALRPLVIEQRELQKLSPKFDVMCGDVVDVPMSENDVLYLDPPYTKRQYAAYYHVLETIVYGDEPEVTGVTGLRPWKDKASDFCYKSKAHKALVRLVCTAPARRTYISYSGDGHIDLDELVDDLSQQGDVTVKTLGNIGRYRPNKAASGNGSSVCEYLVYHVKTATPRD